MKRIFPIMLLLIAVCAWSNNSVPSDENQATTPQKQTESKAEPTTDSHDIKLPRATVRSNDGEFVKNNPSQVENNFGDKAPFIMWLTAEEWNTIFTLCLVAIGAITGSILCWQACLLRRQIKLAREEFIASHRPKIIVRSFQIIDRNLKIGVSIDFSLVAQNIGDTAAKIVDFRNAIFIQSAKIASIPSDIRFSFRENLNPDLTLKSGENILLPGNGGSALDEKEWVEIYSEDSAIYCMGIVVYADEIGTKRETGFCRRYHTRENKWNIIDCEYEYAY